MDDAWDKILGALAELVAGSPISLFTLGANFLFGYLLSFALFSYRLPDAAKWPLHLGLGCGYSAFVFILVNIKAVYDNPAEIAVSMIVSRIPATLLIGGALAFTIFVTVVIIRERYSPKQREEG